MRTFVTIVVIILILGVAAVAWQPVSHYVALRSVPKWKTATVTEGNVAAVVNATGTIKPVLQISVGAFVSGPIAKIHVEFNEEVKKDQLMAEIDPRIYVAGVARDEAALANRRADVERAKAQLQQAIRDENRANTLREDDTAFIAQAEIDRVHYARLSLQAMVKVAETAVDQAQAQLDNSKLSLEYTKIISPCDGIVINRKIDPGQTLASQFQTPELFVVAPDMRKKMYVHAAVDEADIGLIKVAQEKQLPVTFTVDAYTDLFTAPSKRSA
jgi:HlyD family secretion protein